MVSKKCLVFFVGFVFVRFKRLLFVFGMIDFKENKPLLFMEFSFCNVD